MAIFQCIYIFALKEIKRPDLKKKEFPLQVLSEIAKKSLLIAYFEKA